MELEAGRALDVLIAEKIFGSKVAFLNQTHGWRIDYRAEKEECNDPIYSDYGVEGSRLKHYSSDIKAAWEVLEHVYAWGATVTASNIPEQVGYTGYECTLLGPWEHRSHALGETAPLAICRAALKALG